ncbi:MAG: hypothetical protein ACRD5L_18360 [Bryobacteraceae bacterium]
MKKIERMRESLKVSFDPAHMKQMMDAGWRPSSVEWEREVTVEAPVAEPADRMLQEVPFGLRVAEDCHHLEQDPAEMEVLQTVMELIV